MGQRSHQPLPHRPTHESDAAVEENEISVSPASAADCGRISPELQHGQLLPLRRTSSVSVSPTTTVSTHLQPASPGEITSERPLLSTSATVSPDPTAVNPSESPVRMQTLQTTANAPAGAAERLAPARPTSATSSTSSPNRFRQWSNSFDFKPFYEDSSENLKHIAEPEHHNPDGKIDPSIGTTRAYYDRRQQRRLWTLIFAEWLATVALCAAYAGILIYYQRQPSISGTQRRMFNALTTGMAFLLGANLSASLKSYARLLRWRLLSWQYRPLEEFDLILGCDALRNVGKLLLKARRKTFPFVTVTQVVCVVWLIWNLLLALFVASFGLSYGLDDPALFNRIKDGNVSFINLTALQTDDPNADMNAVNTWGIRGLNALVINSNAHREAAPYQVQTYQNGSSSYNLQTFSPNDFNVSAISFREVRSRVSCLAYPVPPEDEVLDSSDYWTTFSYLTPEGTKVQVPFLTGVSPGYGGITAWSKVDSDCGWGCTAVAVFLARSPPDNSSAARSRPQSQYYQCNNTVPKIKDFRRHHSFDPPAIYQLTDHVARILAGALGWSGAPPPKDGVEMWKAVAYTNVTGLALAVRDQYGSTIPTERQMADFVSTFTTKAVAALDDVNTGLREFAYDEHGRTPVQSQRLAVDWVTAVGLFGGMVVGQFVAMVVVFVFANQAVIRDDSPLTIAKLLFGFIRDHGLADKGGMLKSEDIVLEMGNPKVVYGWVDAHDTDNRTGKRLGQIGVFVEGQDAAATGQRNVFVNTRFDTHFAYH